MLIDEAKPAAEQADVAAAPEQADVPAAPVKICIRDRSRERVRYRPGSRLVVKLIGKRKDRLAFLEQLSRCGDPAVAADQLGLPVFELFRYRDADPIFAAEWLAAVNYAWERVESRVLAALLGQFAAGDALPGKGSDAVPGKGSDAQPGEGSDAARPKRASVGPGAGQIDTRLALAIVNRRDKPVTHTGTGRVADGAGAARLRVELRALAGLADAAK